MAGIDQRDAGEIRLTGTVDFSSTADAKVGHRGDYQEPTLFRDLSVTENIFMGAIPPGRWA